ncbi:MAG: tetratricopeptide repeat protein [bacterium]
MTQIEIENVKVNLFRHINNHRFALLFDEIKPLLSELQKWWAISRTEEIEMLYTQMLKYSSGDVIDPNRSTLITKIKRDLYLLVADVAEALATENRVTEEYTKKFYNKTTLDGVVSQLDILKKINNVDSYSFDAMNLLDNLFNAIWLSDRFSSENETLLANIINDNDLIDIVKPSMLSALTLKSQRIYDSVILRIALDNITNVNVVIRVRAQLLFLSIYAKYFDIIDFESVELKSKIEFVLSESNIISELLLVVKYAINTLDTERITRMIEQDIMPEMIKQSGEFRKLFTNDDMSELVEDEDEANPKWKTLFEETGLADKINEYQHLQSSGADIHMSTFSKMKSYPFFSKFSNWFLPFDQRVNDIYGTSDNLPDLFKMFAQSPMMCNSDKYSFFLSVAHMGDLAGFNNAAFNDADILEQAKDEMMPEKWKNSDYSDFNVILKGYTQDIYRYYNLNKRAANLSNPLDTIVAFTSQQNFMKLFSSYDDLVKISTWLFEKEAWNESLLLFELVDKQQGSSDHFFYQQMGFAYQQLSKFDKALTYYEKADVLEPNDVWILKSKASCYRKLHNLEGAMDCYNSILQVNSENITASLALANCYMQQGDYAKARALYFKADFLSPDNDKIKRALAWALYNDGDFSRALELYKVLLSLDRVDNVDALNAGHTFLAMGDRVNAIRCYRLLYSNLNDKVLFVKMMNNDIEYILKANLSNEDISLLVDRIIMNV